MCKCCVAYLISLLLVHPSGTNFALPTCHPNPEIGEPALVPHASPATHIYDGYAGTGRHIYWWTLRKHQPEVETGSVDHNQSDRDVFYYNWKISVRMPWIDTPNKCLSTSQPSIIREILAWRGQAVLLYIFDFINIYWFNIHSCCRCFQMFFHFCCRCLP